MKQSFCRLCGGIKKMTLNGKTIPYADWMKHGIASDAGCICPPKSNENHRLS